MESYQVIEDNVGGLHLAVFDVQGDCIYFHSGYEFCCGQLTADIAALQSGEPALGQWEGNSDDPAGEYDHITNYEFGWSIVCDNNGIYPESMRSAAKIEFGI